MKTGSDAAPLSGWSAWPPIVALWLAGFVLLATNQSLQGVVLNADWLTVPGLVEEILRNPRFTWADWAFPPAPQLVPDTLLFFVLRVVLGSALPAVFAYAAAHLALLAAAVALIARWAFADRSRRLITIGIVGLVVFGLAIGAQASWVQYAWPLVPFSHAGVLSLALFTYLAYERSRERQRLGSEAAGGILSFLAFLSDSLFVPYFAAPYLALLAAGARGWRDIGRLLRIGAVQAAGFFLARSIVTLGAASRISLPSPNPISRGMAMIAVYLEADAVVVGGAALAVGATWAVVGWAIGRRIRQGPDGLADRLPRLLVFLSLAALANAFAVACFWSDTTALSGRYLVAFQVFPPVVLALLAARFAPASILPMSVYWFAASATAAIALTAVLLPRDGFAALSARRMAPEGMEACLDRLGVGDGLAAYWTARPLTTGFDWRHEVAALAPDTPVPFIHNNNLRSFAYEMESGQPIAFDFVVMDNLEDAQVTAAFGVPERTAECAGHRLFVYADAKALTARVQAMRPTVFWCPACTADLRPTD